MAEGHTALSSSSLGLNALRRAVVAKSTSIARLCTGDVQEGRVEQLQVAQPPCTPPCPKLVGGLTEQGILRVL